MKHFSSYFILLFITILTVSCSSSDDASSTQSNYRLIEFIKSSDFGNLSSYRFEYFDNGLLEKYTWSIEPLGNSEILFSYDDNNRITKIGNFNYEYNTQGALIAINKDAPDFYNATVTYTNEDLIENLSGFRNSSGVTSFYNYNITINGLNQIAIIDEQVTGEFNKRILIAYDTKGNVSEIIRQDNLDDINFITTSSITYTYDDKPNITKDFLNNIDYSLYSTPDNLNGVNLNSNFDFRINYVNPNNILTITKFVGSEEYQEIYTYDYNDFDYPISADYSYYVNGNLSETLYYEWVYESY
ncbi:MAG: hypothetical protein WA775_07675 [Psychroserpens sp.]|uniref:hypothetical protein n=1 Tax=Psychroserpens sp. TaxID=2020870 RepID=UPI003C795CA8